MTILTRGIPNDRIADIVLGQRSFAETGPYSPCSPLRLDNPLGCLIDQGAVPQILYIMDTVYNRVLGFDWDGTTLATTPTVVIGQHDSNSMSANGDSGWQTFPDMPVASASTLQLCPILSQSQAESSGGGQLALDSARNLWMPDCFNHRVLRFPLVGGVRQTTADRVIGQADFTGIFGNRGNGDTCANNTLYLGWAGNNEFANGLCVDPTNDDVWVADTANRRVLRFPAGTTTADLVLGQADFTHNASGSGLNQLGPPTGITFNPDGSKLYVCDPDNARIMVYARASFASGMNGTSWAAGIGWSLPMNIQYDPNNDAGCLWVTDRDGPILKLVRESDGALIRTKQPDAGGGGTGGSIGIDITGNIFVTNQQYWYEDQVLLFKKADEATPTTLTVYFPGDDPRYSHSFVGTGITKYGLRHPLAVVPINDQLITHDFGRILFWNNRGSSLANGRPADGLLSPGTSAVTDFSALDTSIIEFIWMTAESQGRYLWAMLAAGGSESNRIIRWTLPVTHGMVADLKICADGSALPLLGGGVVTLGTGWGITAGADSSELWVTQQSENRAFRLRNPLAQFSATGTGVTTGSFLLTDSRQNWAVASKVGATVMIGTTPNRYQLYVTSNSATRLNGQWRSEALSWATTTTPPGNGLAYQIMPTVDVILGQADATSTSVNRGGAAAKNTMNKPGSCQLDAAGNLWVSDFSLEAQGNDRLLVFLKATIPSNNANMLYGPNCDYIYPNVATWQPAFAPTGEMVIAYSGYGPAPDASDPIMLATPKVSRPVDSGANIQGRFPGVYNKPLDASKFDGSGNRTGGPDGYLKDYQGSIGAAFHADGTLYTSDHNMHRILIYSALTAQPVVTPPPRRIKRDRGVVGHRTWF